MTPHLPHNPLMKFEVQHAGQFKMVGLFFKDSHVLEPGQGCIFMHEEINPTQHHTGVDAPGGVDSVVAEYLLKLQTAYGAVELHHYRRATRQLYVARLSDLVSDNSTRMVRHGRDRLFLPTPFWLVRAGLPYRAPWTRTAKRFHYPAPTPLVDAAVAAPSADWSNPANATSAADGLRKINPESFDREYRGTFRLFDDGEPEGTSVRDTGPQAGVKRQKGVRPVRRPMVRWCSFHRMEHTIGPGCRRGGEW